MKRLGILVGILSFIALISPTASCQEKPESVSLCEIARDPAGFNHKLLEVTGLVEHGFEIFNFFDPVCSPSASIWLEYGGKWKSDTTYCCGDTAGKHRSKELVVEKIRIPLVEDDQFLKFDKLIQPPFPSGKGGATVRATLVGRFFAGQQIDAKRNLWGGYGHLGCCSLFAIQQVKFVSPADSK